MKKSTFALMICIGLGSAACERSPEPADVHEPGVAGSTVRDQDREPVPSARANVDGNTPDPARELERGADRAEQDVEQSKDQTLAALQRRLQEIDRELDELDQRATERGRQIKADLREDRRRLKADLDRLEQSIEQRSEETWTDVKQGVASGLEALEREIRQARTNIDTDEPTPNDRPR